MIEQDLDRHNLRRELEAAIPEVGDGSVPIASFEPDDNEPLHATVGIALSERFLRHLLEPAPSPSAVAAYAGFLDRMLASSDPYVEDVATTSVIARILGAPEVEIDRVRGFLGPKGRIELDRAIALRAK